MCGAGRAAKCGGGAGRAAKFRGGAENVRGAAMCAGAEKCGAGAAKWGAGAETCGAGAAKWGAAGGAEKCGAGAEKCGASAPPPPPPGCGGPAKASVVARDKRKQSAGTAARSITCRDMAVTPQTNHAEISTLCDRVCSRAAECRLNGRTSQQVRPDECKMNRRRGLRCSLLHSALFEFGTGFLPSETGAPKGA